jgi:hypothetical protein
MCRRTGSIRVAPSSRELPDEIEARSDATEGRIMSTESSVSLRAGVRLRSQACATEIIVVRPGGGGVSLACGGYPMIDASSVGESKDPREGFTTGNQLGKRYTAQADDGLEILVTKAGNGTLTDAAGDDRPLVLKEARLLPASD